MTAKREPASPEILTTFRAEKATPEDVEALIDVRIDAIDHEIAEHLAAAEALRTERKRWLSVTGGRSRNGGEGLD